MKKSVFRILSLVLAVTLAVSLAGIGTVFATGVAGPVSVSLDSGNVSLFWTAQGTFAVTSGDSTVYNGAYPASGVIISGQTATAGAPRSISIGYGVGSAATPLSLTLAGVNVVSPASAALAVGGNSFITLVSSGQNWLTGGLSVAAGSAVYAASYNGGTLTASAVSNAGTLSVLSGNVVVNGGGLAANVDVPGGTLSVAGSLPGTLTVRGGAVTVNNGVVANATVNAGSLTLSAGSSISALKLTGGTLSVPSASAIPSGAVISDAATVAITGTKPVATPVRPSSITKNTGTSFDRLGLPTTVRATLNTGIGTTRTINLPVVWDGSNYRSGSSGTYTIKGTLSLPSTYKNAVTLTTTSTTISVTLRRSSSGGGGGSSSTDPDYEFWMQVRDRIESAESGSTKTITVTADKYDNMPTSVLEALKGTKMTLVIERSGKADIKIYGRNMHTIPSTQVFYKLDDLAKLYKTTPSGSSSGPVDVKPTPGDVSSVAPPPASSRPYVPPASSTPPSSSSSSSSSSSEEESSSSEEESHPDIREDESSEEEPTEDVNKDVDPEQEKKPISPVFVVAIVAAVVALVAGIVSYIIIRRREEE